MTITKNLRKFLDSFPWTEDYQGWSYVYRLPREYVVSFHLTFMYNSTKARILDKYKERNSHMLKHGIHSDVTFSVHNHNRL